MAPRRDDEWGTSDRPWQAQHPFAAGVLKTALAVGGLLAVRKSLPSLLRATEGMLSSALSEGGMLAAFGRDLGLQYDAAGRVVPRAALLSRYSGWAQSQLLKNGRQLSPLQHQSFVASGVRHVASTLGTSLDALGHETVAASADLITNSHLYGATAPGWSRGRGWDTLHDLVGRANPELSFIEREQKLLNIARTHLETWPSNALLDTQSNFKGQLVEAAQNLGDRRSFLSTLTGLKPVTRGQGPFSGAIEDANILRYGKEDLDLRLTGEVLGGLGKRVLEGVRGGALGRVSKLRPFFDALTADVRAEEFGMIRIGGYQPGISQRASGALTESAIYVGKQIYTVAPEGRLVPVAGEFNLVDGSSHTALRYARILGAGERRPQQIPGVLGQVATALDLGQQDRPSRLTKDLSVLTKFTNPNWDGNLVRDIYHPDLDAATSNAGERTRALTDAFTSSGVLQRDGKVFDELNTQFERLFPGRSLNNAADLAQALTSFSESADTVKSAGLRRLLRKNPGELLGTAHGTDTLRSALAEELVVRSFSNTNGLVSEEMLHVLGGGKPAWDGASGLHTAWMSDLHGDEASRAFVSSALLRNVSAEYGAELLQTTRGSDILRAQLERSVYGDRFGLTDSLIPKDFVQPFYQTPVLAIRAGKPWVGTTVTETLANINENLHAMAARGSSPASVTTATIGTFSPFGVFDSINRRLEYFGLGLSARSTGSAFEFGKNLLLKRALPVLGGMAAADFVGWGLRRLFYGADADEEGRAPGFAANLRANLSLGGSWLAEKSGFVGLQKGLQSYFPGLDRHLNVRGYEEQREFLRSGWERGRDGVLRPNFYAYAAADPDFSDATLTRKEYYNPLRVFQPHYWEKKHALDRPYPVSGAPFTAPRLSGPFSPLNALMMPLVATANATVGALIKPRRTHDQIISSLANINEGIHAAAGSGGGVSGTGDGYAQAGGAPQYTTTLLPRTSSEMARFVYDTLRERYPEELKHVRMVRNPWGQFAGPQYIGYHARSKFWRGGNPERSLNAGVISIPFLWGAHTRRLEKDDALRRVVENLNIPIQQKELLYTAHAVAHEVGHAVTMRKMSAAEIDAGMRADRDIPTDDEQQYYEAYRKTPLEAAADAFTARELPSMLRREVPRSEPRIPGVGGLLRVSHRGRTTLYGVNTSAQGQLADAHQRLRNGADIGRLGLLSAYDSQLAASRGVAATPGVRDAVETVLRTWLPMSGLTGGAAQDLLERLGYYGPASPYQLANSSFGYGGQRLPGVVYENTLQNTMPSWLPRGDGSRDFHHGDPYARSKNAHYTLPGAGFEKLFNDLVGISSIPVGLLTGGQEAITRAFMGLDLAENAEEPVANRRSRASRIANAVRDQQRRKRFYLDWRAPIGKHGAWMHLAGPQAPAGFDVRLPGGFWWHIAGAESPNRAYFTPSGIVKKISRAVERKITGFVYPEEYFPNWDMPQSIFDKAWNRIWEKTPFRFGFRPDVSPRDRISPQTNAIISDPKHNLHVRADVLIEEGVSRGAWIFRKRKRSLIPVFIHDQESTPDEEGIRRQLTPTERKEREIAQAQFAAHVLKSPYAYIAHQDWLGRERLTRVKADKRAVDVLLAKAKASREEAERLLADPKTRLDHYGDLARLAVLALNAPDSEEFKQLSHKLRVGIDEGTKAYQKYEEIRKIAKISRDDGTREYRYARANDVIRRDVTVDRVLGTRGGRVTFTTKEDPSQAVMLTGLKMTADDLAGKGAPRHLRRLKAMVDEFSHQFLGMRRHATGSKLRDMALGAGDVTRHLGRNLQAAANILNPQSRHARRNSIAALLAKPFTGTRAVLKAGLRPTGTDNLDPTEALKRVGITPGAKLHIIADPANRTDDDGDTYGSDILNAQRAVVFSGDKRRRNLSRELLKRELAHEERSDTSLAELYLYHGRLGRAVHAFTENISHAVGLAQSSLERYRTRQFEKRHKSLWHPIRDYVQPYLDQTTQETNPLAGAIRGARDFSNLWRRRVPLLDDAPRLVLGAAGAVVGATGSIVGNIYRAQHRPYKPKRVREEENLNELRDVYEYMRARRTFNAERDLARQEGVDVLGLNRDIRKRAGDTKRREEELLQRKRELIMAGGIGPGGRLSDDAEQARLDAIASVNGQLNELMSQEELIGLPDHAARAMHAYKQMQHTMYGLPRDAIRNDRLTVLPEGTRGMIGRIISHGSADERRELYELLPDAEKRVVGMLLEPDSNARQVAEAASGKALRRMGQGNPDLVQFFQERFLPRENWRGWEQEESLAPAFAKEVQRLGLDPRDTGVTHHNDMRANLVSPLAIGPYNKPRTADPAQIRADLESILGRHINDLAVNISAVPADAHSADVRMNLHYDRSDDLADYLNRDRRAPL